MSARRSSGEGSVVEYATKAGPRWWIAFWADDPQTGVRRRHLKRGFRTKREAQTALRAKLREVEQGTWTAPSARTLGAYLDEWIAGARLGDSTLSSYRKNIRLHIRPHLGDVRLDQLRVAQVNAWLRHLEANGREDGTGGLSPRTVRYVFTILRAAIRDALEARILATDPLIGAKPPTVTQAKAPEMTPWTADQLHRFLGWCDSPARGRRTADPDLALAWRLLAATGMRRGEALALRWSDVDLDRRLLSVRRSVGVVKEKGAGQRLVVGPTKGRRARTVDLDEATLAALRTYRARRGGIGLALVRDDALVLGRVEDGGFRHPERFSRRFVDQVQQAQRDLGVEQVPRIKLHDLRHTHATLLLRAGIPVKVVSERLGHQTVVITLETYAHVMPGMGAEAAATFAALLTGGNR